MMNSVGEWFTRRMVTRMGFASGTHDAELACKIRGNLTNEEAFATGPQIAHAARAAYRSFPCSAIWTSTKASFMASSSGGCHLDVLAPGAFD
jgi:hypothetical protein